MSSTGQLKREFSGYGLCAAPNVPRQGNAQRGLVVIRSVPNLLTFVSHSIRRSRSDMDSQPQFIPHPSIPPSCDLEWEMMPSSRVDVRLHVEPCCEQ